MKIKLDMKLNIAYMKRMVLIACALFCAVALKAQVVDSAHLLINYVPKLNNANKINQQAEIVDTAQEKVEFRYVITPQKPEVTFSPTKISVSKLNPEFQERYYRDYLKVGFGYPITPLAELSVHNTRNTKYSYGLNFHHFSSWADRQDSEAVRLCAHQRHARALVPEPLFQELHAVFLRGLQSRAGQSFWLQTRLHPADLSSQLQRLLRQIL